VLVKFLWYMVVVLLFVEGGDSRMHCGSVVCVGYLMECVGF
jgi:hypothetical protein